MYFNLMEMGLLTRQSEWKLQPPHHRVSTMVHGETGQASSITSAAE